MTEKPQVDFEEVVKASGMPVTKEALRERFNGIVQEEGLITNTSNMSPFWRLITAIVTTPVLWLKDVLVGTVLANMFVATASGQMLRLLAWAVNVTAKPATAAQGVIRFYKADAGAVVTVKAGTLIQTERINGTVYELATTADFTLAAGVASALIPVQATATGGAFNLAPGYYRILPVAVDGISHAVNETDWLTVPGADEESDDELRERCRNQFNLVGNYHTDAVYRSMIASVAGLSIDRIFFEHEAPR
ncbi:baseplate J/gp47 family protein, partial [Cronobacter sakazakii]|nr:baseplate J/gp47 family protein [Cronobacter sakazakii]